MEADRELLDVLEKIDELAGEEYGLPMHDSDTVEQMVDVLRSLKQGSKE